MRLKSLALSFLMLTTLGDLARSNESNTPLSPQLTLTKINELQQKLKFSRPSSAVEPQEKLDSVSLSQRLANLQRLQEMRSQDSVPSDQINPSVLQSLSVQPEGVVIDTSGKEPKILVNSEQEPGVVHITLNGILLDPQLNLSQDTNKTNSAIQSIRVNQISTQPAIAEIIIQTPQKNWQLIPHGGSFLLTQIKNDKLGNQELSASASEITLNSNTELTEENNSTSSSQLSVAIESFIQNYYKNWQLIPHEGSFILTQVKNNKTEISETETTLTPNSSSQVSAAIELFVEKHYKNWQLIPHEGSFILSQRKSPTNVDIQSSIINH